jgi:hypothetical protein
LAFSLSLRSSDLVFFGPSSVQGVSLLTKSCVASWHGRCMSVVATTWIGCSTTSFSFFAVSPDSGVDIVELIKHVSYIEAKKGAIVTFSK